MRPYLVIAASASVFFRVLAAADGDVLDRAPCILPKYEEAGRIERYATKSEYNRAVNDKRFVCEKLKYSSGGLGVVAFLYRRADAGTFPLVVFNRGGYVVSGQLPLLVTMFHRLAEAGFTVIAPMYRGSEGASGRDEMGGADLADLFNVIPLARQLGIADLHDVFLYGESRGGVMSLMALRDGFPTKAAATFGAFTNLAAYLEGDPRAASVVQTIWPDYEKNREDILSSRSATRWAERIAAPLLLMHGGSDGQVDPRHTLRLAIRLQELGKPYGVVVFAGDDHILSGNRIERDRHAISWFKRHLGREKIQID